MALTYRNSGSLCLWALAQHRGLQKSFYSPRWEHFTLLPRRCTFGPLPRYPNIHNKPRQTYWPSQLSCERKMSVICLSQTNHGRILTNRGHNLLLFKVKMWQRPRQFLPVFLLAQLHTQRTVKVKLLLTQFQSLNWKNRNQTTTLLVSRSQTGLVPSHCNAICMLYHCNYTAWSAQGSF